MTERQTNYTLWIDKAESDRLCIQNNMAAERVPWDTVCFHAQQAAEKYLKAFLVYHYREFPRTHDLVPLLDNCCQVDGTLAGLGTDCTNLTPHGVSARYPDDTTEEWVVDAHEAVKAMERVRSAILSRLPERVDQPD